MNAARLIGVDGTCATRWSIRSRLGVAARLEHENFYLPTGDILPRHGYPAVFVHIRIGRENHALRIFAEGVRDGTGHRARSSHGNGAFLYGIAFGFPDQLIIKAIPAKFIGIFKGYSSKCRPGNHRVAIENENVPMRGITIKEK